MTYKGYFKIAFLMASLLGHAGYTIAQQDTEELVPVTAAPEGAAEPGILAIAEISPEFPGGEDAMFRFIAEQTHYPEKSRERGEQGVVYVQFIVNEDGSVSNATVLRGVSRLLDAEAIRVVEAMPRWKPGYQRGKAVKVYYKLPFRFALEGVEE